jgi:hypothetical protein
VRSGPRPRTARGTSSSARTSSPGPPAGVLDPAGTRPAEAPRSEAMPCHSS